MWFGKCRKQYCGIWKAPKWVQGNPEGVIEYFDRTGRLIGMVRPFGDVFTVHYCLGLSTVGDHALMSAGDIYLTLEQAKAQVESKGAPDPGTWAPGAGGI